MQKENLKIVFMGTPVFAKESLKALVENGYNISLVVSQPDRQSGRGMKFKHSPVKEYSLEQNLEMFQPEKIKNNEEFINKLKSIKPDLIIVVAYGKILPKSVLEIPKYGCINVHGSLLPKFRGAAPIQRAIIDGEIETGITTMYMDVGMDTGDMIYKSKIKIETEDTYKTLHDKLMLVGAELLVYTMDNFLKLECDLPREKQDNEFTVAPMIDEQTAKINFNEKGINIVNKIRGLNNLPGAFCIIDQEREYKIYEANYINIEDFNIEQCKNFDEYSIGEIIHLDDKNNMLIVKCKDCYINIKKIKPKNKSSMSSSEYIRSGKIKVGDKFCC